MTTQSSASLVSVHGGHSAEFGDASDSSLEEMINAYIAKDFEWVGITEHIPPVSTAFMDQEEIEEGHTVESRLARFAEYFSAGRALQDEHKESMRIFLGFETECYTGYKEHVERLRDRFQPDYIVGSVHHVRDIDIDGTPESYREAVREVGGTEELYCEYFDLQYDLMETVRPEVVGHFDLIRMHDRSYRTRLVEPQIEQRIQRNLQKVKDLDAILDYNVRAFDKGGTEPYVSRPILEMALDLGVPCVPGDDSHGVAGVGKNLERGIRLLQEAGFSTVWKEPASNGT